MMPPAAVTALRAKLSAIPMQSQFTWLNNAKWTHKTVGPKGQGWYKGILFEKTALEALTRQYIIAINAQNAVRALCTKIGVKYGKSAS